MPINTEIRNIRLQLRQGKVDDWEKLEYDNPLLGEPLLGYNESDNNIILKFGDGNNKWNSLQGFSTKPAFSKITGENEIIIKDISPLEHNIKVNLKNKKKNILPYPYYETSKTYNGITFTDNKDGTITVNGEANENSHFILSKDYSYFKDKVTYVLSSGNDNIKIALNYFNSAGEERQDATFTWDSRNIINNYVYGIYIRIPKNTKVNNVIIAPQLEENIEATDYEPNVIKIITRGKNLIKPTIKPSSNYNVQYTVNDDKSVTLNGTSTGQMIKGVAEKFFLPKGTYTLSGCPAGGSQSTYTLFLGMYYEGNKYDYGDGVTFTLAQDSVCSVYILTQKGQTFNNAVFKPQIEREEKKTSYSSPIGGEYDLDEPIASIYPIMNIFTKAKSLPLEVEYNTDGYNDRDRAFTKALGETRKSVEILEQDSPKVHAVLEEMKQYMTEHGGSWDAIELENEEFKFKVNNEIISHTTGNQAAGLVFTPIYNALYETDKMELPYWGNLAIGKSIRINNTYSSAFGLYHNIEATGAFVTGIHNTILRNKTYTGQYAVVMGQSVGAMGNASFSTGFGPEGACQQFFDTLQNTENPVLLDVWKGVSSDRGKRPAIAVGKYSARFGLNNATLGYASFAAGGYNVANGDYSFTMGENTQSLGKHSCSFGYEVTAEGEGSTGFGKNNQANGSCSFVGGYMNQSLGNYSTAFGQNNQATSSNSFAVGTSNIASGSSAIAVGTSNIASGSSAIAVGNNNHVSNQYSFGAGLANLLINKQSFALGSGLQSQNTGEVLVGYLNKKVNNAILTVGNGTGNIEKCKIVDGKSVDPEGTVRSNAFVVYQDGHAEVASDNTSVDNSVPRWKTVKEELNKKVNATSYNSYVTTNNSKNTEQDNRLTSLETNVKSLSGALQFKGIVDRNPTELTGYSNGDVVIWNESEYVWYDNKFNEFGPATDFVTESEFTIWKNNDYGRDLQRIRDIANSANDKADELLQRTGYTTIKTAEDGWIEVWVDDEIMSASKTYQGRIDEDYVYGSHWSSDNFFYYNLTDIPAKYHQLNCNIHNIYGYNLEAESPNIEYPHWATIAHHPGQTNYTIMFRGSEGPGFGPDIYSDPELQIDYLSLSFTITLSK